jgi:hypothetical protein
VESLISSVLTGVIEIGLIPGKDIREEDRIDNNVSIATDKGNAIAFECGVNICIG